jgi:glycosyltransferase involved in cell wall biosynthesis
MPTSAEVPPSHRAVYEGGDGITRLIYVTARFPYGATEPFLVPEIAELGRLGCDVSIVPTRPDEAVAHADAQPLIAKTVSAPLLSGAILRAALGETVRAPVPVVRAAGLLLRSRNPRILLKNLAVLPKALWLARLARRSRADHLHAHWASTPATMAMLASEVAGIRWSLTAHRWDIAEDNLLRLKARSACFVRVVSEHGAGELRQIVDGSGWSPWVLHMGVPLPERSRSSPAPEPPLRALTAARLVEKKGHDLLFLAVDRLKKLGVSVRVDLAGDGPLAAPLRDRVSALGLDDEIVFLGSVPHDELVQRMAAGAWHVAVLPSIVTSSGELEGIPVSLIEAMACGLPVVGTAAGGTPELLREGAGLLVPPGDPAALAQALEKLADDPSLRAELGAAGRKRVEESFAIEETAAALLGRFAECGSAAASPS